MGGGGSRNPSLLERGRGPPRSGGRVRGFTLAEKSTASQLRPAGWALPFFGQVSALSGESVPTHPPTASRRAPPSLHERGIPMIVRLGSIVVPRSHPKP